MEKNEKKKCVAKSFIYEYIEHKSISDKKWVNSTKGYATTITM